MLIGPLAAHADCTHSLRVHVSRVTAPVYRQELKWLQQVLAEAGCRVSLQEEEVASFGRILHSLEEGKHDFAIGLSSTPERESRFYMSTPYTRDNLSVYVSTSNTALAQFSTLDDLTKSKNALLIPLHGWYGETFDQFRTQHQLSAQVLTYQNDPDGLRLALNNPETILLMSDRLFDALIEHDARQKMRKLNPPLFSDPLHIAFSRRSLNADEFRYINDAIVTAIKNGNTPDKRFLPR